MVVGSDLKWWKINPCDTSSRKNMFQGIHRCDMETTTVNELLIQWLELGKII